MAAASPSRPSVELERSGSSVSSFTLPSLARSTATQRASSTSSTRDSTPRTAPPCFAARPSRAATARRKSSRPSDCGSSSTTRAAANGNGSSVFSGSTTPSFSPSDDAASARKRKGSSPTSARRRRAAIDHWGATASASPSKFPSAARRCATASTASTASPPWPGANPTRTRSPPSRSPLPTTAKLAGTSSALTGSRAWTLTMPSPIRRSNQRAASMGAPFESLDPLVRRPLPKRRLIHPPRE